MVATSWIGNLPGKTAAEFEATHSLLERVVEPGGLSTGSKTCMFYPAAPCTTTPANGI